MSSFSILPPSPSKTRGILLPSWLLADNQGVSGHGRVLYQPFFNLLIRTEAHVYGCAKPLLRDVQLHACILDFLSPQKGVQRMFNQTIHNFKFNIIKNNTKPNEYKSIKNLPNNLLGRLYHILCLKTVKTSLILLLNRLLC